MTAELIEAIWPDETPRKTIVCRHCRARNRVDVPLAVFTPAKARCGACRKALFLSPDEAIHGLTSQHYEHPMDRRSLSKLRALPGFAALSRKLVATVSERALHLMCLSSNVRVDEEQFPELLAILDHARMRLDYLPRPALYLRESPAMNAMTVGAEEPLIIVFSALLDQMDDAEVSSVLGHELGHLQADHIVYKVLARLLLSGGSALSDLVRALSMPIQLALLEWDRASELTGDRAGLLVCADLGAALRSHMVLSGGRRPGITERTELKLSAFIRQSRELAEYEQGSWWNSTLASMLTVERSHPYAAWRVMHLLEWVESGNYLDILSGNLDAALEHTT